MNSFLINAQKRIIIEKELWKYFENKGKTIWKKLDRAFLTPKKLKEQYSVIATLYYRFH